MSRRLGSGVCFPTMCATGSIRRTDEIRQEQIFDPKDASNCFERSDRRQWQCHAMPMKTLIHCQFLGNE